MMAQDSDKPELTHYAIHHCVLCGALLTHDGKVCSVWCAQLANAREKRSADLGHELDQQRKRLDNAYALAVRTGAARDVLSALGECMTAHALLMDLVLRMGPRR